MTSQTLQREPDPGFTLVELLISVLVTSLIVTVIAFVIVVSLRTLPGTTSRADSSVAVQGITTWLPSDVDSTEPGGMDSVPSTASGCSGVDPGRNMLRLNWKETFQGITTRYVAAYRFVPDGTAARIVRLACSGTSNLGVPVSMSMSGRLASTPPQVTLLDADRDGQVDQLVISVTTLAGAKVFIDAASKNPSDTLPPIPPSPTDTTTTTTTAAVNRAPVAGPVTIAANPMVPVVINLPTSDPDGDPLTVAFTGVPAGWQVTATGATATVTPGASTGTFAFGYTVSDPAGASATSTITLSVSAAATTTSTSTTTTTSLPPPCVVSAMTVSPSTVTLSSNGTGKLKKNVSVGITVSSGYCVGLTLQYDTGAPNGQYIQNFGNAAPYGVTLYGHPQGTELWAAGPHQLTVRDGTGAALASKILTVTN